MRAVRIEGPGRVAIVDLPRPPERGEDELIRVAYVGLCATDRRLAARELEAPRVPGHEVSGWTGEGRPVGVHPDIGCGTCAHCSGGFENRCQRRVSIGIGRDGGLAEWLAVPRSHVLEVSSLDPLDAVLLEPLACCLHAVALLGVVPGTPAVVVGAGPMGILATWALQARGARVAVSQRSDRRRRDALLLGADAVLAPEDDVAAALGESPEVALVTAPGSEALGWAIERVAVGGRVHAFAGSGEPSSIDADRIHYRHLTLMGSTGSTMRDYREAYALATRGGVDLARLPRDILTLGQAVGTLTSPAPPERKQVVSIVRS